MCRFILCKNIDAYVVSKFIKSFWYLQFSSKLLIFRTGAENVVKNNLKLYQYNILSVVV